MKLLPYVFLGAIVGLFLISFGQWARGDEMVCAPDAFRLCPHTIPDQVRTARCLYARKAYVQNPECRREMFKRDFSRKVGAQRNSVLNHPAAYNANTPHPATASPH